MSAGVEENTQIDRLALAIPDNIRQLQQWLVWKYEPAAVVGQKPRKVPYYVNGQRRRGEQGSPEDRAALVTFDRALQALESRKYTGVGLAFFPGSVLNAVDFDNCVSVGVVDYEIRQLIDTAGTYAELSPSGTGVRMLGWGDLPSMKHTRPDGMNVELFGNSGFVTITGTILTSNTVREWPDDARALLLAWANNLENDAGKEGRSGRIEQVRASDPIYQRLKAQGIVLRDWRDGKTAIVCPFHAEHTGGAYSETSTTYFAPSTYGYQKGHFHCFHAHCANRTDADFLRAVGFQAASAELTFAAGNDGGLTQSVGEFVRGWAPPEFMVDGMVQRSFVYALTGHTNAGKTSAALRLAMCLATGRQFGGRTCERTNVVFFAGENPEDIKTRIIALAQDMEVDLSMLQTLRIVPLAFPLKTHIESVKVELNSRGEEIGMIFVDTKVAYSASEDENDNIEAMQDARALRDLCGARGRPSVIALCHPAKGAQEHALMPRGGYAFLGEIDSNLTVWNDGSGAIRLHHGKLRGPSFEPMMLRLRNVDIAGAFDKKGRPVVSVVADPIGDDTAEQIEKDTRNAEDLLLLAMHENPHGVIRGWAHETGKSKSAIQRMLNTLHEEKLVCKRREKWMLTKAGKTEAENTLAKAVLDVSRGRKNG